MIPLLRYINVKFRKSELKPNWYNGKQAIYLLHFHECSLEMIRAKTFALPTFEKIKYMGFFNQKTIICLERDSFYGLPNLEVLAFSCIWFGAIDPMNSFGFENSVHIIELSALPQRISLQDLLKSQPLNQLYSLQFANNFGIYALAPENFTSVPNLIILDMSELRIEIIFDGTFDVIGKTLRLLHLCDTRLLHIKPSLFYTFLFQENNFNILIPSKFQKEKTLIIHLSPIKCDCGYYILQHLALATLGIVRGYNNVKSHVTDCHEPNGNYLRKCNLKPIHLRNVCLNTNYLELIGYPKFRINFSKDESNRGHLRIDRYINATFRIIFIQFNQGIHEKQLCQEPRWLRKYTKCFLLNKSISNIWLQFNIHPERFIFIGVIFVNANRIWPLNFILIRPTSIPYDAIHLMSSNLIMIAFQGMLCVLGFIIGIISIIFKKVKTESVFQLKDKPRQNLSAISLKVDYNIYKRYKINHLF